MPLLSLILPQKTTQNPMKIVSYNCFNFKANHVMVKLLMSKFDICFFCEHWLGESEGYLFNDLCSHQASFFSADFENNEKRKGRPYGGRCWIINNNIPIKSYEVLNKAVSRVVVVNDDGFNTIIYGIWQPYDDNSIERLSFYHSTLAMLEADMKDFSDSRIVIMGDFNSDLNRGKRFDLLFKKFIDRSGLFVMSEKFGKGNLTTYSKGEYRATIDHILGNKNSYDCTGNFEVMNYSEDVSDHKPISCNLEIIYNSGTFLSNSNDKEVRMVHKFPWNNVLFLERYTEEVDKNCKSLFEELNKKTKHEIVLEFGDKLGKLLLKAARVAEANLGINTKNGVKKGTILICYNNEEIVNTMRTLRIMKGRGTINSEYAKGLKKQLRKLQRLSCFNRCKSDSLKLDSLLSYDRNSFWNRVKSFKKSSKKKATTSSDKPNLNDFTKFYENLFSHEDRPSNYKHLEIEREVCEYFDSHKNESSGMYFSEGKIREAVGNLKAGKAAGIDNLTNEFFKNGNIDSLIFLLKLFFDSMGSTGFLPSEFNTAIIIPIPKSDKLTKPVDYRPISLSTPLTTIFECIMLEKLACLRNISPNQFGYRKKTSCKNAFFIANEAISFYESGKSNCHVISLDAAKAFDKMWRQGLFYKLMKDTDAMTWRLLYEYYSISKAVVRVDGQTSCIFKTTQGVKQGGTLSPFLFNYFMDGLLKECCDLEVGAHLGSNNVSCLAYCDDLLLISPVKNHMDKLLRTCFDFANNWKVKFNASKSTSYSLKRPEGAHFSIDGIDIPVTDEGFIYLGMPIGTNNFTLEHFGNKFWKVEKAFYSLRGLGCRSGMLDPKSISFIYRVFCQSICKFGLECLTVDEKFLGGINVRQNILIKGALGLNYRCKTKPLLQCLNIEQIGQFYHKHKIFGIRQFLNNNLSCEVFLWLRGFYEKNDKVSSRSFFSQLRKLESLFNFKVQIDNLGAARQMIDSNFVSNDLELTNEVDYLLSRFNSDWYYGVIRRLNVCLSVFDN